MAKTNSFHALSEPQVLMIFLKEPLEGRVKTRLGATIGHTKACLIYKEFVRMIANRVPSNHWQTCVFFDTAGQDDTPSFLQSVFPKETLFIRQEGKDLGERLKNGFEWVFQHKTTQKAAVIGGDSPDLPIATLQKSFEELDTSDITVGPTSDGGYYLLSMKQFSPKLFDHISWSTESVFQDTCTQAKNLSLSIFSHPIWEDVDTWEDFQIFQKNNPHFSIS